VSDQKSIVYYQLEKHLPSNAVHYCLDLWVSYPFIFVVSRERSTKLGDYRYERHQDEHTITVNNNLNRYNFLITYLHEVAHRIVSQPTRRFHKPHGWEWKAEFRRLLSPMMNDLVFPLAVLVPLKRHMRNPKATTQSDPELVKVLRQFDNQESRIYLSDIQAGLPFSFKGRNFKKESVRRTRAVCIEIDTGKKYLISEISEVQPSG